MKQSLDFQDKTILITGSTRGIGYGYAEYLASLGANIIVNGISEKKREQGCGVTPATHRTSGRDSVTSNPG